MIRVAVLEPGIGTIFVDVRLLNLYLSVFMVVVVIVRNFQFWLPSIL